MNQFDMPMLSSLFQCFYHSYGDWVRDFLNQARYDQNSTFYTSQKISNLQQIADELPSNVTDENKILDSLITTAGYDPLTFASNQDVIDKVNQYYSQKTSSLNKEESAYFRSVLEVLGDNLEIRFNGTIVTDDDDKDIKDLVDNCDPFFVQPSSVYHGTSFYWSSGLIQNNPTVMISLPHSSSSIVMSSSNAYYTQSIISTSA